MKHSVDPTVDCVFKAILGPNEHIKLLLNFITSVCHDDLISPITDLTIINPYNEKELEILRAQLAQKDTKKLD